MKLTVFDILGREVAVLADEALAPGAYDVVFDATGLGQWCLCLSPAGWGVRRDKEVDVVAVDQPGGIRVCAIPLAALAVSSVREMQVS